MLARVLETGCVLVGVKVGVDELDKAIEVLGRNLLRRLSQQAASRDHQRGTHSLVLLVEVVYIAIEDLNKQFNTDGCVHACVSHSERTLQAFKHTLAVTVELCAVSKSSMIETTRLHVHP